MNRATPRLALACVAGLALLTTACTAAGTTGSASPASTTGSPPPPASPTSTNASGGGVLAGLKPCDLLTSAEVGQLGLEYPGEADRVGSADLCRWQVSGNGSASAGIRTEKGVADLNYEGDNPVPTTVGKYSAIRVEAPLDAKYMCHVVISTSESSSVQVIATVKATSVDTAAACDRATKAAELIAPKLP